MKGTNGGDLAWGRSKTEKEGRINITKDIRNAIVKPII